MMRKIEIELDDTDESLQQAATAILVEYSTPHADDVEYLITGNGNQIAALHELMRQIGGQEIAPQAD